MANDHRVLAVEGVSSSFGAVKAVEDVSFPLYAGETTGTHR